MILKKETSLRLTLWKKLKNNIITIFRSVFNGQNYADFRRDKKRN